MADTKQSHTTKPSQSQGLCSSLAPPWPSPGLAMASTWPRPCLARPHFPSTMLNTTSQRVSNLLKTSQNFFPKLIHFFSKSISISHSSRFAMSSTLSTKNKCVFKILPTSLKCPQMSSEAPMPTSVFEILLRSKITKS